MATKTIKFYQGLLTYTRNEGSTEFTCERCNTIMKSKNSCEMERQ